MALLKLEHLKSKYHLEIKTIAHVGAHRGQEVEEYLKLFDDVKLNLFEPQQKLFKHLKNKFQDHKNINYFNLALGSYKGSATMHTANTDGQSSSILEPKEHLKEHPQIKFHKDDEIIKIRKLDELGITNIDLLNIDTQGYELEVLKGGVNTLNEDVKYMILEVNKRELYKGCPVVSDIDKYLYKYNFIRTDTHYWRDSFSWGDAFYIRKDLISFKRIIFSIIKNYLYGIESIYKLLIFVRNIAWKIRGKTS